MAAERTGLYRIEDKEEILKDGGSEEEEDEDVDVPAEAPEDAWFIPLGWAHQCPPVHYRSTDPEWRSFVEFANDRQRVLSVQSMRFPHLVGLKRY